MANIDKNEADYLAAEFVLGVLQGDARDQFVLSLQQDATLRQQVRMWEQRLFVLTSGIKTVNPPSQVWEGIERRINPERRTPVSSSLWKVWSIAASVLLLISVVYLVSLSSSSPERQPFITVVSNESGRAGWIVKVDFNNRQIITQNVKAELPDADKDYELWLLPKDSKPISIGLVRAQGTQHISLADNSIEQIDHTGALAVSLEPKGGSPTGQPTGPVVYQGKLTQL